jgi:hypothetical protein
VSIGASLRYSYLEVCHVPENNTLYNCVSSTNAPTKDNTVRLLATDEAAALNAGQESQTARNFNSLAVRRP